MLHSNKRKLALSGWLLEHNQKSYVTPLKLQKYLLFYEAFSKVEGDSADFSSLKGYRRGPVFSTVWGDYTHERDLFDAVAEQEYASTHESINELRAKRSSFIVDTLSEEELSDLTHKMNLWKAKESRIMQGERQVELSESDFNENDIGLICTLSDMYPETLIENSSVIEVDNHYFVFSKADAAKLTEWHFDTLSMLAEQEELSNPVFVELDGEGRLIVD